MTVADAEIVKEVQSGNRSAFAELVKRHQQAIFRLAMRFAGDYGTAEDITQETFVKAYQNLANFEFRSSFKSWLFRIAINNSKNRLRATGRTSIGIDDLVIIQNSRVEQNYDYRTMSERLYEEVQKLPVRQKMAMVLRIYEDMDFQEIALAMECPYDTAKANFRHGVLKIRSSLGEAFFDELAQLIDQSKDTQIKVHLLEQSGE